jgi:hypothetical protein
MKAMKSSKMHELNYTITQGNWLKQHLTTSFVLIDYPIHEFRNQMNVFPSLFSR